MSLYNLKSICYDKSILQIIVQNNNDCFNDVKQIASISVDVSNRNSIEFANFPNQCSMIYARSVLFFVDSFGGHSIVIIIVYRFVRYSEKKKKNIIILNSTNSRMYTFVIFSP